MSDNGFNTVCEKAARNIARVCHLAWQTDIMRGFSGNASVRIDENNILITPSGAPKGRLEAENIIRVNATGAVIYGSRKPSIELGLHLAIYAIAPDCHAILHTHPVWLQVIANLADTKSDLLDLNLAEADYWRERLAIAPECPPGSTELASGAVKALRAHWATAGPLLPCAIWLTAHGLCALGDDLDTALGISEQLEHLAHIEWGILAGSRNHDQ